jgi:anhydro-N-acetylmuramic acid kinase
LTARSIAHAYRRFLLKSPRSGGRSCGSSAHFELVPCGGGARNPVLMEMLGRELPEARLRRIEDFGIPSQAKEAISFSMLAKAYVDGVPANLPQVTGALRPAVMGRLVEP